MANIIHPFKLKYYGNSKSKIQSILGARKGRHIVLSPHPVTDRLVDEADAVHWYQE